MLAYQQNILSCFYHGSSCTSTGVYTCAFAPTKNAAQVVEICVGQNGRRARNSTEHAHDCGLVYWMCLHNCPMLSRPSASGRCSK